ncbi:MAG TPA: DUF2723 domain-containing protein [Anaerolineae bacterium]
MLHWFQAFLLRRNHRLIPLAIVIAAALLYLPTLQPHISGGSSPYLRDVGNVQNALSRWGTLHGSGYPLYAFSGSLFVTLLRGLSVEPALAAGLYSTLWAVATLVTLYAFLVAWLDDRLAAAIAVVVLGTGWVFWLHSAIAEVYSMGTFIIALALWLAIRAERTGHERYLYGLAICCGMVLAHHRALALALPSALLIAAPAFLAVVRRRPLFVVAWIGIAAVAGALPYLYVLIRTLQGADWLWGDPSTPAGFWRILFGEAYTAMISWPATGEGWRDLIGQIVGTLSGMVTWIGMAVGLAGAGWLMAARQFRYGLALMLGVLLPALFAISVQATFLGQTIEDVPALLQMSVLFLFCGAAFALHRVRMRWPALGWAGALVGAMACGLLVVNNQPVVYSLTHDSSGSERIALVEDWLSQSPHPSPPAFFALWGNDYWQIAYAHDVTRELTGFDLLPNRADVAKAAADYGEVNTFEWTLYSRDLAWWDRKLGRAFVSSVADRILAISTQPILSEADLPRGAVSIPMGKSIALRGWQVEPDTADRAWHLTLYWQALSQPERDYSVFVHASDRDVIDSPDAIITQADSSAPVYGWYPTARWSPGEIVRDDYVIRLPPERTAKIVSVGMYYQDPPGTFHNVGEHTIALPALP